MSDFTDIDSSISAGLSLASKGGHHDADAIGVAMAANRILAASQACLAAGGMGILIGDGAPPHPGTKPTLESDHAWHLLAPGA